MRSIWNGAISFGLVSIPIKLVNATESHSISFRQIHLADGGRVRYRKVCELDGEEVSGAEIGKGYEEADGSIIPITDDDLAQLPLATAKTIEIMSFVPAEEIDPLQMDAAYYLAANGATAAKPYTLLREALKRSRKVAIAKYALRGRERLGMLRVVDDVIAMHGLLWPDEIRAPEGVAPEGSVSVRDAELDLADALMATLGEVEMASLRDDYREAVEAMVTAKAGGAFEPSEVAAAPAGGQVIDLMAALEKSVRAAKASRGEPGPGAEPEGTAGAGSDAGTGAGAGAGGGAGAGAEVTPIRRKAAAASPKAVGGKKSTAAAAKKTASAATKKTTATGAAKSAAKSTAVKSTAVKSTSAKTTSAKSTAAATKKTATAKKAAPTARKRTSA
ncbi:Ku protein [Streptomyces antarcticus]|uniref:non-homologous end joining protein Ku n=1 Tax=Streptomyces antarcticus TaxID=2996458 RepID=UPI002271762B|nr:MULTISPECIES: Ku protein [unclassified Streptomyces]MCY0940287.1 Ku protein [Streptomyces sp. H34-AA3]MCZ4088225.1 Ku protein [Streptomyces sp. H34-S5]